jgi:drug/metabolite transporter (DMT)-like permease
MFSALSPTYKGILFGVIGYSLFAFADVGTKWLTQFYSIYEVIVFENLFSIVLLLILAAFSGGLGTLFNRSALENWKVHLARGIFNFAVNLVVVYSFHILPLASVYTAAFMMPFVGTLIAIPLYKEKVHIHRWSAIIAGFIGILIAFQPWSNINAMSPFTALVLALVPITVAAMHMSSKSYRGENSAYAMAFWPILISFIMMTPFAALNYTPIDVTHLPVFAFSGCMVALAIAVLAVGYKISNVASVSSMLYFEMVWAIIFGYLVFGDLPDAWMMAGAAIIIISGIYLIWRERKIHHNNAIPAASRSD